MIAPKITLIHATPLAMQPIAAAFAQWWPQAQCSHLLDEGLAHAVQSPAAASRVMDLAQYAERHGAQGILFTCSAFGGEIDAAKRQTRVPTFKPNEAMLDEALDLCAYSGQAVCRIGLLTTFAPAAQAMREELLTAAQVRGLSVQIESAHAATALAALQAGDTAGHDQHIVQQALTLHGCDVLLLGQFSMAHTQPQVAHATGQTVLCSPDSAVRRLRAALQP